MPISGSTMSIAQDSTLTVYRVSSPHSIPVKQLDIYLKDFISNGGTHSFMQTIKSPNNEICISLGKRFIVLRNNKVIYCHYFNSLITQLDHGYSGKIWIILQYEAPVCYNNDTIETLSLLKGVKEKQITVETRKMSDQARERLASLHQQLEIERRVKSTF